MGDEGHVAAHNGVGAVAGSKNLKAIVVHRGKTKIVLADEGKFKYLSKQLMDKVKNSRGGGTIYNWGTSLVIEGCHASGALPVKNYTTNLFPEYKQLSGKYTREHFEIKPKPCWACPMHHCHTMKVTKGKYAGYVGEEPDYEQIAAWGPIIGQTDPGAVVMLANEADKIGLDANESGWLIAWVMECFEKGIINRKDTDGLEMTWGNVESVKAMLEKIAKREGIGDLLAEGVMRASRKIGGEAPKIGIYTYKGNTPRGHDHRALWWELFDTCVSNTGTIESSRLFNVEQLGLKPISDNFSPEAISTLVAKTKGHMAFEDSLIVCRFTTSTDLELLSQLLNAATGWDFTVDRTMDVGKRIVNLMKVFNLRNGITSEMDNPSERYGSAPVDGPAAGKHILPVWGEMLRNYYKHMGWDEETGKPLPKTLKKLGLENIISQIW